MVGQSIVFAMFVAAYALVYTPTHPPPHPLSLSLSLSLSLTHTHTQSLWMYMATVFSGGDIVKQLPAEARRFQNIDRNFMRVCWLVVVVLLHDDLMLLTIDLAKYISFMP